MGKKITFPQENRERTSISLLPLYQLMNQDCDFTTVAPQKQTNGRWCHPSLSSSVISLLHRVQISGLWVYGTLFL